MEEKLKHALESSVSRFSNPQTVSEELAGSFRFVGYFVVCGKTIDHFAQENNCVICVKPANVGLEITCAPAQVAAVPVHVVDPSQFGEKLFDKTTTTTQSAATAVHTCSLPAEGVTNAQLQNLAATPTVVSILIRKFGVTVITAVPAADTHSLYQCIQKGGRRLPAGRRPGWRSLKSSAAKAAKKIRVPRRNLPGTICTSPK